MKLEDLQKKLKTSRTTLYRYMKGINQITPDIAECFAEALNMSTQQSLEFRKLISLSAIDRSLIESRDVLDDFLFEKKTEPKPVFEVDMVLYDNDRYLRTLKEIFDYIYSFSDKEQFVGTVKIYNCMSENIFSNITLFLQKVFSEGASIEAEQFIGLSERDYLQNAYSFINTFPLMKYDKYKFYYKELETTEGPLPDSILVSLNYTEEGNQISKYFVMSFFENGLSDCIAFHDKYMYMYLSRIFEGLKISFTNIMRKYNNIDFDNDIFTEMKNHNNRCLLKPNPCYDKIPLHIYEKLMGRMNKEELLDLFSSMQGHRVPEEAIPAALNQTFAYLKDRIDSVSVSRQIDVYSKEGITEFFETGRLTDHLELLPSFNREEIKEVLENLYDRSNDTGSNYTMYIAEDGFGHDDFVFSVFKDYGIIFEYVFPNHTEGLWKMILIENKRLASIFYDYFENHIPVNNAMTKTKANEFLKSLINQ